jgi:Effector Associated Constant Component 1
MSGAGTDGAFEVAVEPRNDHYDPDDEGWRDQVATLYAELDAQVDTVRRGRPVAGTKGAIDQLVIALGGAGVFGAAVDCLRAWLGRDRDRRVDVRWTENGVERSVTLTGEAVDDRTVREIAEAAVARAGGPPWPASTGPC